MFSKWSLFECLQYIKGYQWGEDFDRWIADPFLFLVAQKRRNWSDQEHIRGLCDDLGGAYRYSSWVLSGTPRARLRHGYRRVLHRGRDEMARRWYYGNALWGVDWDCWGPYWWVNRRAAVSSQPQAEWRSERLCDYWLDQGLLDWIESEHPQSHPAVGRRGTRKGVTGEIGLNRTSAQKCTSTYKRLRKET